MPNEFDPWKVDRCYRTAVAMQNAMMALGAKAEDIYVSWSEADPQGMIVTLGDFHAYVGPTTCKTHQEWQDTWRQVCEWWNMRDVARLPRERVVDEFLADADRVRLVVSVQEALKKMNPVQMPVEPAKTKKRAKVRNPRPPHDAEE